jgi:hypothetical protein
MSGAHGGQTVDFDFRSLGLRITLAGMTKALAEGVVTF